MKSILVFLLSIQILPSRSGSNVNNALNFDILEKALVTVGTLQMCESIYGLLAGILHMGNIYFENDNNGHGQISNESYQSFEYAADLLSLDSNNFKSALFERQLMVPHNQENVLLCIDLSGKQNDHLFFHLLNLMHCFLLISIGYDWTNLQQQE